MGLNTLEALVVLLSGGGGAVLQHRAGEVHRREASWAAAPSAAR